MVVMASDMLEVCSRCGKMPRGIELGESGLFRCIRCGNNALTTVTNSDYEKIVTELDQEYHARMLRARFAAAKGQPVKSKAAGKKTAAKKSIKKAAKKRKK